MNNDSRNIIATLTALLAAKDDAFINPMWVTDLEAENKDLAQRNSDLRRQVSIWKRTKGAMEWSLRSAERRIAELEDQVNDYEQAVQERNDALEAESVERAMPVARAIIKDMDNKIRCIKVVRNACDVGLRAAKIAVERALDEQANAQHIEF